MSSFFLFLDIDGVCNNTLKETYFDPFNVTNVKRLVDHFGATVVLSSDWRRSGNNMAIARSELLHFGITIFDITPIKKFGFRHEEIREWLNIEEWFNLKGWTQALILDDMKAEYVDPQMDNVTFFQTDYKLGLTEDDVDKIINLVK